jgi:uncharacterized membrane protein
MVMLMKSTQYLNTVAKGAVTNLETSLLGIVVLVLLAYDQLSLYFEGKAFDWKMLAAAIVIAYAFIRSRQTNVSTEKSTPKAPQ